MKTMLYVLIVVLALITPNKAFGEATLPPEPLSDIADPQTQVNALAAYALATTTYAILRKNDVPKLTAFVISHVGAAALSVAYDQYLDDSKGYVSRSRQGTTALALVIGATISINVFP